VKVGDLVELSTYGKKRVLWCSLRGYRGIIIERVHELSRWKIHWFGNLVNVMNRKDIKHVKAKKRPQKES